MTPEEMIYLEVVKHGCCIENRHHGSYTRFAVWLDHDNRRLVKEPPEILPKLDIDADCSIEEVYE